MLKPAQARFCALYAVSMDGKAAYMEAFPDSAPLSAEASASRMLRNDKVQAEIQRIRDMGAGMAYDAAMEIAEVHSFLARVVRSRIATLPDDSDLWQSIKRTESGTEYKVPDKLGAIAHWSNLKGKGSAASAQDAITAMLARAQK